MPAPSQSPSPLRRWLQAIFSRFSPSREDTPIAPEGTSPEDADALSPDMPLPEAPPKDAMLEASRFLNAHPLYKYLRRGEDGIAELNVVIVGEAPIRCAFFSILFSAAQMLDTRLKIHVLAKDASQFYSQLKTMAPLLPEVCHISVGGRSPSDARPLNPQLVEDKPLAILSFTDMQELPVSTQILELDPSCVLLMDIDCAENARLALDIRDICGEKLLIGIANDSFDSIDLAKTAQEAADPAENSNSGNVLAAPFLWSYELGDVPADFYADIHKKALDVHTFYALRFHERASSSQIRAEFEEPYHFRSSLRSALSIPYKLHACGLADAADPAGAFHQMVLSDTGDKALLSRLVWLEHRSWQAYMIMEGWQLLPESEYESVLFAQDNLRHSYKKETFGGKWHPCLCASFDSGKYLPMEHWDWARPGDIDALDPLDRSSARIHQCFVNAVQDGSKKRYHTSSIQKQLQDLMGAVGESNLPYLRELENVTHRVLNRDPGADRLWLKLCDALQEKLSENSKALRHLEQLRERMDVHIRCLHPRDFKRSDQDVIEAIPVVLQAKPIGQIVKLCSDNSWENVIAAPSLRPQKLVLLTEVGKALGDTELRACRDFLTARGLDTLQLEQCSLPALPDLSLPSVLDITGASAAQMLSAMQQEALRALPVIEYRDGQVRDLNGRCPELQLYRRGCTLSVRDVLTVSGARVISDKEERHLLGMGEDAIELWRIAQNATDGTVSYYNNFCTLLKGFCMPDTEIYKGEDIRQSFFCNLPLARRIDSGMEAVLDQLEYCDVIRGSLDGVKVEAKNKLWQGGYNDIVNTMAAAIECNANDRAFQLVKIPNPLYQPDGPQSSDNAPFIQLVRDKCLEHRVRFPIQAGAVTDPKTERKLSVQNVEDLMDALQQAGMLLPADGKSSVCSKSKTHLYLHFAFASPAVRECLTKEGNVQEAFVYRVIRDMNIFDDLKLSVSIAWDEQNKDVTTNEIDLIGTKGSRSYFISCKKRKELKAEQLTEIRYETDRFGIDGVPILIATARDNPKNHASYVRAKRMGVHIITLQDYLRPDGTAEDSVQVLQARLKNIVNNF